MRVSTFTVVLAAVLTALSCGDSSPNTPGNGVCGDNRTAGTEECDDGNTVDGDGCDASCRFSCVSTDTARNCDSGTACVAASSCNDATHTCTDGLPVADDAPCNGGAGYCMAGVCKAPVCGNNDVEPGEECEGDDGCNNCRFVCTNAPATQCGGGAAPACRTFACAADHTCTTVADDAAEGTRCDPSNAEKTCVSGSCVGPAPAPGCGNGVRESDEQCDDGNNLALDGCDAACKFEEVQRLTSLVQQFGTDAFCPTNALGAAITLPAQEIIQATWAVPITDGTLSIVFKFLGLRDLTGGDSPFTLGFVKAHAGGRTLVLPPATPTCGNGICEYSAEPGLSEFANPSNPDLPGCPQDCTYNGNNDLDWWYVREPASVDASETPIEKLSGQITSGRLTAGPGTVTLNLLFAFEPADVTLFDTKVEAAVDGPVNKPTVATTAGPPGHLASEHLLPSLTSVTGSSTGSMCSQVSAASLFRTPLPQVLRSVCTSADPTNTDPVFTPDNTLLDAFVSGCLVFSQPGIAPSQPDGSRDGATYRFQSNSALTVTGCTRDGVAATLVDCLAQATFSSYFKFSAGRVILKRE